MSTVIQTEDLYKNQYNYEILKANIYAVSLMDILKTQVLTSDFCIKYILNPKFHLSESDKTITIHHVLQYQPHITFDELVIAQIKVSTQLTRGERTDSFDDFDTSFISAAPNGLYC